MHDLLERIYTDIREPVTLLHDRDISISIHTDLFPHNNGNNELFKTYFTQLLFVVVIKTYITVWFMLAHNLSLWVTSWSYTVDSVFITEM